MGLSEKNKHILVMNARDMVMDRERNLEEAAQWLMEQGLSRSEADLATDNIEDELMDIAEEADLESRMA